MVLTLPMTPQQEALLHAGARRAGLPVGEYVVSVLLKVTQPEAVRAAPALPLNEIIGLGVGAMEDTFPAASTERPPMGSLVEAFAQWREEDATDDPEELARRDSELAELKAGLNANRAANGERPLFP